MFVLGVASNIAGKKCNILVRYHHRICTCVNVNNNLLYISIKICLIQICYNSACAKVNMDAEAGRTPMLGGKQ